MRPVDGCGQDGQTMAIMAALMLFYMGLFVFLVDSGIIATRYMQLSETIRAAAEDGSRSPSEAALRQSGGQTRILDPAVATAEVDRTMTASGLDGLSWSSSVDPSLTSVTVTARMTIHLPIVGSVSVARTKSGRLHFGQ